MQICLIHQGTRGMNPVQYVLTLTPFQTGTFSVSVPDMLPPSEAYDRFARQWRSQASTKWNGGCSDQRDPSTVDTNIYTRHSIV